MIIFYNMIEVIYLLNIYYCLLIFLAESFITLIYKSFFEYFFGYLISNVGMHHYIGYSLRNASLVTDIFVWISWDVSTES